MANRRLRAAFVLPAAGGAVGAIVAAGIAAGVAISGGAGDVPPPEEPTTTTIEATDDESAEGEEPDRPAPLDVLVFWDGSVVAFAGVAQSVEQVDSLGSAAPGSVDVAGPGAVTADVEVSAFGEFVAAVTDTFGQAQFRLTVDSLTLSGVLLPGVSEDDVVVAIDDAGLGGLRRELDLTAADDEA